jgi:hypothetical protein
MIRSDHASGQSGALPEASQQLSPRREGQPLDPVPLSHLGPGIDRRRADPTQSQHHQLDRRLLGRASIAGRRPDRRPQARDPDRRRGGREIPRRSRRPEPGRHHDPEAPGAPGRQAPALLRATRLSSTPRADRRGAAGVPADVDLLAPVRGQAPRVPAGVPALLLRGRLD